MKKLVWMIPCCLLTIVVWGFSSLRFSTTRRISEIEALMGRTGAFTNLVSDVRTRYRPVTNHAELEHAKGRLGAIGISNLTFVRFSGEGVPYFYGWVAYDPVNQEVVKVKVDQLW